MLLVRAERGVRGMVPGREGQRKHRAHQGSRVVDSVYRPSLSTNMSSGSLKSDLVRTRWQKSKQRIFPEPGKYKFNLSFR